MIEINGTNYCEYCFHPIDPRFHFCDQCGSKYDPSVYPDALPVGTVLAGRYFLGRVLGRGGFGVTYLGFSARTGRRVAIKEYFIRDYAVRSPGQTVISPLHKSYFDKGRTAFYNEATLLHKFNYVPGIVKVEEYFRENNTEYYVMEYLDGQNLEQYFSLLPPYGPAGNDRYYKERRVIEIAMDVLRSLNELHGQNIYHRDIAPDNILVTGGRVKLIDFGTAREKTGSVTKSLSVILKRGYAPHEQYSRRGNQGPWTDIYALGATMYRLLTGRLPPDGLDRLTDKSAAEVDMTGISTHLAPILRKMLAVKVADRYRNAAVVLNHLQFALQQLGGTISEKKDGDTGRKKTVVTPPAPSPIMDKSLLIAIVCALCAAILVLILVLLKYSHIL